MRVISVFCGLSLMWFGSVLPAQFERRTPTVRAVELIGPAVVNIRGQNRVAFRPGLDMFPMMEDEIESDGQGNQFANRSLGSGVIVHPDGYVVTNEHVVSGTQRIKIKLRDGREFVATVLNANRDNDVGVLKIEGPGPFPYAELGNSDDLLVGEPTIALGNPFGLSNSVTDGILSAVGRSVRFRNREVFSDFLQTSAIINPGNSGGPLLDINGRVIGINVAIDNRGPGISYAIPINRVKEVMTTLLEPEMTKLAWLGIEPRVENGALVAAEVPESGPAYAEGVRVGDRILAVGTPRVTTPFQFNIALPNHRPGQSVPVRIQRTDRTEVVRDIPLRPLPLEDLVAGGPASIPSIGLVIADLTRAAALRLHIPSNLFGPVVMGVEPGSSAESIGIEKGDVIMQIGSLATPSVQTFMRGLRYYDRRGSAEIRVYREKEGQMKGVLTF
jgi:serine protease Do